MDWEVFIPILMFLFPLVVSILDKRAKKRKGIPPVKSAPVGNEIPDRNQPWTPVPPVPPIQRTQGTPEPEIIQPEIIAKEVQPRPATEGERAIVKHEEKKVAVEEKPKLEIDKKKLILYSEILKPKFDA